jgi:hypothetical protein
MANDDVQPSPEATWLRANWNRDRLGQYEKLWIAVKDTAIIYSSPNLETILSETIQRDPLYAYVYFDPLQ